jgi:Zn-dependent M28 family amino/carboxypeptidase
MLVNDPGFATKDEKLFKGNAMTYYGRWTYKYEEAARQGAAAAIIIHETAPASYGWDVVSGSWTGEQYDLVRPDRGASRAALEGWISYEQAENLFNSVDLNLNTLKSAAAVQGFAAVTLPEVTLNATINQDVKTTTSRNVAGGITGTKYPDEYVLYMAHWDHLGKNDAIEGPDKIYNGAVDNATGTSAILEIGEAFVQQGAPERSAIFVAVTAEESGLLGSAYYAEDPLVPLEKTVAGVNIDGIQPIGRTKDMKVIGFGASELEDRLKAVLDPRDMYVVPDDKPEAGYYYRSDHISLAKKGVPMLYSNVGNDHITNGLTYGEDFSKEYRENRYHKPADEYDNSWDLSGIEQSAEIFFELGYGIANSRDWPNWYEGTEFRALRDEMRK